MMTASHGWFRHARRDQDRLKDGLAIATSGVSPLLAATAAMLPQQSAGSEGRYWLAGTRDTALPTASAFALILVRDLADDLVQETLMKAWAARARFQAGTNMRAWTFIILRNLYLSQMRRSRFRGEWDDLVADRILAAPAGQDKQVELGDMQRALLHLPQPQREALILVGAGGFAYEEAAEICGVAVGTIKSRVARGRVAVLELLVMDEDLARLVLTRHLRADSQ